jgi:hypothetical protein
LIPTTFGEFLVLQVFSAVFARCVPECGFLWSAAASIRLLTDSHLSVPRRRRMAATLHAKINRKRLDKLDIIKIW